MKNQIQMWSSSLWWTLGQPTLKSLNEYCMSAIKQSHSPPGSVPVYPVCEEGSVPDAALIGMAECQMTDGWMAGWRETVSRCVCFWVGDSHLPVPRAISQRCVCPHVCCRTVTVCLLLLSGVFVNTSDYCVDTPERTLSSLMAVPAHMLQNSNTNALTLSPTEQIVWTFSLHLQQLQSSVSSHLMCSLSH